MNIQGTLEAIHLSAQDPAFGDDTVIDEPQWISALLRMAPAPDVLHRGGRWVQTRSQYLGDDRTLYAVVSGDQFNQLRVTAHTTAQGMVAELARLSYEIAGRPRGARIHRMNAADLLHRTVVNEHGVAFHVGGLTFDGYSGAVWIERLHLDEDGEPIPGTECDVTSLDGWDIH